jgi:hypothetical protein
MMFKFDSPHRHSACNRKEIEASQVCGCFYCQQIFSPSEITEWHEETSGEYSTRPDPWTAMCPKCGIDSVIGDASGFPVADKEFLKEMNRDWFS